MVRRRIVARLERDVGGRASRQARKHLASAESAAKSGDVHACYAALSLALKSVIEGRLGESIGSMTYGQLGKHLLERGMDEGLARRVVEELEGIEFARFSARGGEEGEMRDGIERVRRLIVELERFVPTTPEDG
jgi:HEPN domain-containing protein